jgi:hypothetical protein
MNMGTYISDTEAERGSEGYRAIDGNWLKKPVGYCAYHHGYLTEKLVRIHRCHKKHGGTCSKYHTMEGVNIKRMRQDQFYDKALDRMQKLEASINRAVRSLDRIATALEQEPETPLDKVLKQARDDSFFGGIEAIEQDAREWENIHK